MSKKNITDQFSAELEDYFSGTELSKELGLEQAVELIETGRTFSGQDFSGASNKQAVLNKIKRNVENRGDYFMNRTKKLKRISVTAATVAVLVVTFMQTTFAQEVLEKVKNTISLGHITAIQVERPEVKEYQIPDELKGKIFDKDGNVLEVIKEENAGEVYAANGEKIVGNVNGEIVTESQKGKNDKERKLIVKDSEKLNDYTCFKVILPESLPDGFKFDRAEFYKDNAGKVSKTKYIDLFFTNETTEKNFFMQQRFADEETAFELSTYGDMEKVKINNVDAVIHDTSIDWEYNGVLYSLIGKGELDKNELIKMAESIK